MSTPPQPRLSPTEVPQDEIADLRNQLRRTEFQLNNALAQLHSVESRLGRCKRLILEMRASVFWRARDRWFRIRSGRFRGQNPAGVVVDRSSAPRQSGPKILVVDEHLPRPDQESGSLRLRQILQMFQTMGYAVLFLPDNGVLTEPYATEMAHAGIELVSPSQLGREAAEGTEGQLEELERRLPEIDVAWVCRSHICDRYFSVLRQNPKIKIVFDTVDLHFVRMQREWELSATRPVSQKASWEEVKDVELRLAKSADMTVVVTDVEKQTLDCLGAWNVNVVPNIHPVFSGDVPGFGPRAGLLFIGGYRHPPNVDAVRWFCAEVMPIVWRELPDVPLTLLGSEPPAEVKELATTNVFVPGYLKDVEPYFLTNRLFVAPLRYGAGMKGKVGQSLSYGLPVVTTSIGAEGMGLTHGTDALIADDPEEFARAVVAAYRDQDLWGRLSKNSQSAVRNYGFEAVQSSLTSLMRSLQEGQTDLT